MRDRILLPPRSNGRHRNTELAGQFACAAKLADNAVGSSFGRCWRFRYCVRSDQCFDLWAECEPFAAIAMSGEPQVQLALMFPAAIHLSFDGEVDRRADIKEGKAGSDRRRRMAYLHSADLAGGDEVNAHPSRPEAGRKFNAVNGLILTLDKRSMGTLGPSTWGPHPWVLRYFVMLLVGAQRRFRR